MFSKSLTDRTLTLELVLRGGLCLVMFVDGKFLEVFQREVEKHMVVSQTSFATKHRNPAVIQPEAGPSSRRRQDVQRKGMIP